MIFKFKEAFFPIVYLILHPPPPSPSLQESWICLGYMLYTCMFDMLTILRHII